MATLMATAQHAEKASDETPASPQLIKGNPKLLELADAYKNYHRKNDLIDGYRLQIAFSNDRQEVYGAKARLYKEFPGEHFYVLYEQPSYKLRMGDFKNRLQAFQKLQEVLHRYPGAFVVKDWVKPR